LGDFYKKLLVNLKFFNYMFKLVVHQVNILRFFFVIYILGKIFKFSHSKVNYICLKKLPTYVG